MLHRLTGLTNRWLLTLILHSRVLLIRYTPGTDGLHMLVLKSFIWQFKCCRVTVRPIDIASPFILFPLESMVRMRPIAGNKAAGPVAGVAIHLAWTAIVMLFDMRQRTVVLVVWYADPRNGLAVWGNISAIAMVPLSTSTLLDITPSDITLCPALGHTIADNVLRTNLWANVTTATRQQNEDN